jgi:hypothetical protein
VELVVESLKKLFNGGFHGNKIGSKSRASTYKHIITHLPWTSGALPGISSFTLPQNGPIAVFLEAGFVNDRVSWVKHHA